MGEPRDTTIGGRCRAMRLAARMSFREAAEALGTSLSVVQRYESGERVPPADVLTRMADVYRCDPCYLLTGRRSA